MALQTQLQYNESCIVGQLTAGISASASTITARLYDQITGLPRAPLTTTRLWVIDKGSPTEPTERYEIFYAPNGGTTTDDITTFSSCVRGLAMSGVSLATGGLGKAHVAQAEIGVVDLHYFVSTIVATLKGVGDQPLLKTYATESARDSDVSAAEGMYCIVESLDVPFFYDGTRWVPLFTATYQNAAARDAAITSPRSGMSAVLIDEGVITDYYAATWNTRGSSTTANASTSVAGKVQEATDAQAAASTQTGTTGARLFLNPGTISTTAASNKIPIGVGGILDRSWYPDLYDVPFFPLEAGEGITLGQPLYIKQSDSKAYRAFNTTVEAATVVGFALNTVTTGQTVYIQTGGEVPAIGTAAGIVYYLGSTAGSITSTQPVMNSSGTIPVKLGLGHTLQSLIFQPVRLQRVFSGLQSTSSDPSYTFACGFTPGIVTAVTTDYIFNSNQYAIATGFADTASGTNYAYNVGRGVDTSNFINLFGINNVGSNATSYAASRSGTDLILTRTATNGISASLMITAYENI